MKKILLLLIGAVVALTAHADVTIKVKDVNNWNKVKIWAWSGSQGGDEFLANNGYTNNGAKWSYPGPEMTFNASTGFHEITFKNAPSTVKFTKSGDKNFVTKEYAYAEGKVYYTDSSDEYTIYFYDKGDASANHDNTLIHVWNGGNSYKEWAKNEKLTSTGKFFKKDNVYYPVWQYTIVWNDTPKEIKFHLPDGTEFNNLTFEDGGVYSKDGKQTSIDKSLSSADLTDKAVTPGPQPGKYTVYFYHKPSESISDLKAYVWGPDDKLTEWNDRQSMTRIDDKYVYVGNENCPVYSYSFDWDKTPENIVFSYNGGKTKDLRFSNEGFYTTTTPENQGGQIGLQITDFKKDVVTIYMHFKEDWEKEGNTTYAPRCHVFKNGTEEAYKKYSTDFNNNDETMTLVNSKYQIWAYEIPTKEFNEGFDKITFYFYTNSSADDANQWRQYNCDVADDCKGKNLAKFIYTTQAGGKAPRTYLSYDKFMELDAQGRPYAYIVGDPAMTITIDNKSSQLAWNPAAPAKVSPEDGCFYLELKPDFGIRKANFDKLSQDEKNNPGNSIYTRDNKLQMGFKVGWINVSDAMQWAGVSIKDDARVWATYDLGIIGPNDLDPRCNNKITFQVRDETVNGIKVAGQQAQFHMNTSVSYLNYNQYNWTLVEGTTVNRQTYWAVIDTHSECRSATLCSFNPHPSVTVLPNSNKVASFATAAEALVPHNSSHHLHAAEANGHVIMQDINYCSGSMKINGLEKAVAGNVGFMPTYTITMQGEKMLDYEGFPARLDMEYMPLEESSNIGIRAKYTDTDTKITFHSRPGSGSLEGDFAPAAPVAKVSDADYVFDGCDYHIIADIEYSIPGNTYNVYGDYTLDNFEKGHAIAHKDMEMVKSFKLPHLGDWTPSGNNDCDENSDNWATLFTDAGQNLPVLINSVYNTDEYPVTDGKMPSLPETEIKGQVYAVYPILYKIKPDFKVVQEDGTQTQADAPRRVAENSDRVQGDIPTDLEGYAIKNLVLPANISYLLNKAGVVSGVENVVAEAAQGEAEYYTLSGVRVYGQPAPGLYILRQGGKASKVVVK